MKKSKKVVPRKVVHESGLYYTYIVEVMNVPLTTTREIEIVAKDAADAVFMCEFNHCKAYDFTGKKIEFAYSIRYRK